MPEEKISGKSGAAQLGEIPFKKPKKYKFYLMLVLLTIKLKISLVSVP